MVLSKICHYQWKQIVHLIEQVVDFKKVDRVLHLICEIVQYSHTQVTDMIIIDSIKWNSIVLLIHKEVTDSEYHDEVKKHLADILEYTP